MLLQFTDYVTKSIFHLNVLIKKCTHCLKTILFFLSEFYSVGISTVGVSNLKEEFLNCFNHCILYYVVLFFL